MRIVESQWEAIKQKSQALHFKKDQVLFYEEHMPYGIYLIESGSFIFSKEGQVCNLDHEILVKKDRVLGLKTLLEEATNEYTCTAASECDVFFISKTQVLHCFDEKSKGP